LIDFNVNRLICVYPYFSALTLLVGSFDPWKPVTDTSYNAFGGTLNLALSIYLSLTHESNIKQNWKLNIHRNLS